MSSDNSLSKIYQDSEEIRVTVDGKKIQKMRENSLENSEQFWANEADNLIWLKKMGQDIRMEFSVCKMVYWRST